MVVPPPRTNGWSRWEKYVLKELTRQGHQQEEVLKKISHIKEDIATLKVKSGLWGAGAGAATALLAFFVSKFS